MPDARNAAPTGMLGPTGEFVACTPSNIPLDPLPRAVYVGTAGDLVVIGRNNNTVTLKNVPAGSMLPIRPTFILPTSSATDIVILY